MLGLVNQMKKTIGAIDNGVKPDVAGAVFDDELKNFRNSVDAEILAGKMFLEICLVEQRTHNYPLSSLAMYILSKPHTRDYVVAKYPQVAMIAEEMKNAYQKVCYNAANSTTVKNAMEVFKLKLDDCVAKKKGLSDKVEEARKEFKEKVMDVAEKIAEAKKKEEEKLRADVIEATATPVEEDQNAVAAYLPEGKEIVKRGRKPKAKENIKDAEIVEENFKVAKQVEPPKAVPLGSAAQPTQATVPPVPMPENKTNVAQPQQPQQAAPVVQPPVQQTQSDMPNLNNLIKPEEPVKNQKTFIGPKVKIVEDKPVEEFGLKPDVKVTTPPSQQIIDPPMPQPVNPQYASIPNMGNFKVVPPETNVNTGINNPILLFKENIGEVGFILTFGNYVVPKEIFTRLDYSNLVNTQFDCGIILCDITSIFGNPETYRMIKDITKNDYLPMFRYVGNNPSGRAVFYSEQVNGKTVRIEVIENNGTANISVKAI